MAPAPCAASTDLGGPARSFGLVACSSRPQTYKCWGIPKAADRTKHQRKRPLELVDSRLDGTIDKLSVCEPPHTSRPGHLHATPCPLREVRIDHGETDHFYRRTRVTASNTMLCLASSPRHLVSSTPPPHADDRITSSRMRVTTTAHMDLRVRTLGPDPPDDTRSSSMR